MLKAIARRLAKRSGYEVLGPTRAYAAARSLAALLQREQINVVLDVGANIGQFVTALREGGYNGRVISYEPVAAAHEELLKQAQGDARWQIASRTAVGAESGSVTMHVAGNSVSSSVLEMLPTHSVAAPESTYVRSEQAQLARLDDLYEPAASDRILLKIDVQGYEQQVLDGAENVLRSCRAVILEMSLAPLYDGQPSAHSLWDGLAEKGFEVWALEPGFRDPATQRMLQMDGFFVRRDK